MDGNKQQRQERHSYNFSTAAVAYKSCVNFPAYSPHTEADTRVSKILVTWVMIFFWLVQRPSA